MTTTIDPQKAADARATLLAAAPSLTDAQRLMMLAQAWYESRWGRGSWIAGSNNWGSMQATTAWKAKHAADPGYGVLPYTDASGAGAKYAAGLMVFPTQLLGCQAFVSAVAAYAGGLANIASDPASYATMLHPRTATAGGNWYEGQVPSADIVSKGPPAVYVEPAATDAVRAQYASAVSSSAALVTAALAAADAQGLVGDATLARPDAVATTGAHAVEWFVGDSAPSSGGSLIAGLFLLLAVAAWKARGA